MTYRQLIDRLSLLPPKQLDDDVTIVQSDGEVYLARLREVGEEDIADVLYEGHLILESMGHDESVAETKGHRP